MMRLLPDMGDTYLRYECTVSNQGYQYLVHIILSSLLLKKNILVYVHITRQVLY